MTTYYVDYVNGADANNGLGPDASHGTNKPWKTLAKVLGASGIASGDTCYLSPAGPFRERVTVAMTSATGETFILGDPMNLQGFKTSGGIRVQPGPVVHTAFETNDTTTPSATGATLVLSGRDYLTFQYINFIGGKTTSSCVDATTAVSTNIKLLDCGFFANVASTGKLVALSSSSSGAFTWTIDRCTFFQPRLATNTGCIHIIAALHATVEYTVAIDITNSFFLFGVAGTGAAVYFTTTGAGSGKPYGCNVAKNTSIGGATCFQTTTSVSSTTASLCQGNLIWSSTGITAAAAGQINEDYNWMCGATRDSNVTNGASSTHNVQSYLLEMGQSSGQGLPIKQAFSPLAIANAIFGYGLSATYPDYTRAGPSFSSGYTDSPAACPGCEEIHQHAQYQTTTVQASTGALQMKGYGTHVIAIPVDAVSTTISIYGRYDSDYDTNKKPRARLRANSLIGFAGETKTMTAAVNTWEQLTFSAFTPAAKGVVYLELVNRDISPFASLGLCFWDTLAVS
jgi:hypothetical protein